MGKRNYNYVAFKNMHNGIYQAIHGIHFASLEVAREFAKSRGLNDENGDYIARYDSWGVMQDKTYEIK